MELREESTPHSSSQWSARIFLPPLSFKLPIDEWASGLPQAGGGGGSWWWRGGRGARAGSRMSGSLLRCLQEAGLWLDLRQHLCNRSCLFWNTYTVSLQIIPDFLWGKFSARRLRIFTHITLLFLLIVLIRVCLFYFFVVFWFFFPLLWLLNFIAPSAEFLN